ncbi:unnamed protein product [Toxocara canis]|uniref:Phosphopyruvate hydratase n=1 Tax=Toxocara canis TaxID=6265 RepID=A0A183U331_TOXCA|nr:unnamed protein product [Toxocara canis]
MARSAVKSGQLDGSDSIHLYLDMFAQKGDNAMGSVEKTVDGSTGNGTKHANPICYSGVVFDVDACVEQAKQCKYLPEDQMIVLCDM